MNILGKISKIIGIIVTCVTIGLIFIALGTDKNLGLIGTFAGLAGIAIIWYIGVSIYSLFDSFKKYSDEKITLSKFKFKWFKSLAGSIIIILSSIILFSFSFNDYLQDKSKLRDGMIKLEQLENQVEEYDAGEMNKLKKEVEQLKFSTESNLGFGIILSLLPFLLLIPHLIFMHKTNKGFIKGIAFPFSISSKMLNFQSITNLRKLDTKDVIIISLIIGAIIFLLLGYGFGETERIYYNTQSSRSYSDKIRYSSHKEDIFKFNYATAFAGFIISSGISYLLLNKLRK